MQDLSMVTLFVENPTTSAAFYTDMLGRQPVHASPTFVMFVLPSGLKFGLWARHAVQPDTQAVGGGTGEICFPVADAEAVEALHADYRDRGLRIIQPPVTMPFGHTFVALDPDGHWLRVYAPSN